VNRRTVRFRLVHAFFACRMSCWRSKFAPRWSSSGNNLYYLIQRWTYPYVQEPFNNSTHILRYKDVLDIRFMPHHPNSIGERPRDHSRGYEWNESGQTGKSKAISLTGRGGLYGCEMLRILYCLYNRLTDGGKVVGPTHRPRSTPQKYYLPDFGTHLC
jgi:hypothetical protein